MPGGRRAFFRFRLVASATLLALFLGVVRFAWYPEYLFELAGVKRFVLILVGVVLVIGPVLSTFVYRPGKRGLKADLILLFAAELVALLMAGVTLYDRRPQYLVFVVDRFEVVTARDVADMPFRHPELEGRPLLRARLVYAQFPDDPAERAELKDAILIRGEPEIGRRPDHWYPYADNAARVLQQAIPYGDEREPVVPVLGRAIDGLLVLDHATAVPVRLIEQDPWSLLAP